MTPTESIYCKNSVRSRGYPNFLGPLKHIMQITACLAERPLSVDRTQAGDKREEICPNRFAEQWKRCNLYKMRNF